MSSKAIALDHNLRSLMEGHHASPFDWLGCHAHGTGEIFRAIRLGAVSVAVLDVTSGEVRPMARIHPDGLWVLEWPGREGGAYRLVVNEDGQTRTVEDPYRFPLQITDFQMYLIGAGAGYRTYDCMGAQAMTLEGVSGVHFAVWAPNARRVSVIGAFNRWDGRQHPMQRREQTGLWELFIPGLTYGELYKYEIKGRGDYLVQKADPYGFASELRPQTASMVWDLHAYAWQDGDWLATRAQRNHHQAPISVYEVHLGSWRRVPEENNRWLTYRELAETLIPYVREMGFTHIEILPVTEHPFDGSWGYQTIGYYSPTSRFGSPDDFKYFVDRCHQAGLGVILDWVPAHFPKDGHGLGYFDGTHLYEHADPRQGEHSDWGTLIFNYGRNEVRAFLLSSAIFWADVYHVDGIRVDAVASMLYLDYSREPGAWVPNEHGGRENLAAIDFLKRFNEVVHAEFPGFLTFAEESTAWPMVSRPTYLGGLGFDFKWNMGWMHDMLEYFSKQPVHRKFHHDNITFSLLYAFTENFILPFSHDEVVHGKRAMLAKMPGDLWQQCANLRLLLAYMYAHPGKKLLFMGAEIGQWNEWDFAGSVDWHLLAEDRHRQIQRCLRDLNRVYAATPALHQVDFSWEGFEWVDYHDSEQSIIVFLRKALDPRQALVCLFNFTPVPRPGYRVGVPHPGAYRELINTDDEVYGGGGIRRARDLAAEDQPWQNQPASLELTIPPLAAVYLQPV